MRTGGQVVVDCLVAQGVARVFCVPGESYLPVLDALRDAPIRTIVTRHEGAAAMMAEAEGKLSGRPGVALVTRGPGATNAAAGVHVAREDSTPLVLLVGQIARGIRGRGAFQEVDLSQTFRDLAKWADTVDDPDRLPEMLGRAWAVAMAGRPGPVVLALPEDVLRAATGALPGPRVQVAAPAPGPEAVARFGALLAAAARPVVVAGGSRWDDAAVAALRGFATRHGVPVAVSFRRQGLFDHLHPCYAGDVGLGINPDLYATLLDADMIVLLGGRFSENPSQDYGVLAIPQARQTLVHVHPGAEELGRVYAPALSICATPGAFLAAVADLPPRGIDARPLHAAYRAWSDQPPATPGAVQMGAVMRHLAEVAPDAVITNGAGNYATWVHRFWRFRRRDAQVAPTSGSMGYGLPAAIAAKLHRPDAEVLCFAGDGCFQMTLQEFATAVQEGVAVIVLVVDNGILGTIRMHQERHYPGRVVATDLRNPDFAAWARACGGHGETVRETAAFPEALARARACGGPALIHLITDPEAITPTTTIAALRRKM